jgi:hypothetical protein
LLQPIADAVKLLMKEDIIPDEADKAIFWFAPLISVTAGMLAMSALAIGPWFQIADLNWPAFYRGNQRAGNFRNRAGRMVLEQPLFAAGRAAQRRATGELRNRGGDGDCGRAAARRDAFHAGNY